MDTIKFNKKNVKIIAHRGLSGIECENTNAAFVAAGNRSYFGIETDVHITADGKFVLVRQYRHALGVVEYELCAGTMDAADASPLDAAKRELLEETGYAGGEWSEFTTLSANPTSMNNLNHTFVAKGVEKVSAQHLDETEEITVHLFTKEELLQLNAALNRIKK